MLGLIWAQAAGRVIGQDGDMPWYLPEDLAHFKAVTLGHPIVMGRRTWDSFPIQPLPGRLNVVLSSAPLQLPDGAAHASSLEQALALADVAGDGTVWGVGGATLYRELLPLADVIELTEIDLEVQGDTFAPEIGPEFARDAGSWLHSRTGLRYRFVQCARQSA